jgi:hypothetical protein
MYCDRWVNLFDESEDESDDENKDESKDDTDL